MIQALRNRLRATGQALVEFALAATLIFFLLAAAVDLGLIFFTLQGLNNAAQEGAVYGSRHVLTESNTGRRFVDVNEVRNRVRYESGDPTSNGNINFVNLLDLDNDDEIDVDGLMSNDTNPGLTFDTVDGGNVVEEFIEIEVLTSENVGGEIELVPEDESDLLTNNGTNCLNQLVDAGGSIPIPQDCFVRVTVTYEYRLVFPLAPAFGETIRLTRSHTEQVIDTSLADGSAVTDATSNPNTPTPEETEGPTLTPSQTPTFDPLETPSPTPPPSETPTPTETPTLDPSVSPSPSPIPSETPIPTDTPTVDPSASATPTPTETPTPSVTPTPTFTPTPTPTPALYVEIVDPENDGLIIDDLAKTTFRAIAYNRADSDFDGNEDTVEQRIANDGAGIGRIYFEIQAPPGIEGGRRNQVAARSESVAGYCTFGGNAEESDDNKCLRLCPPSDRNCENGSDIYDVEDVLVRPGSYLIRARAESDSGLLTDWVEKEFSVPAANLDVTLVDSSGTPLTNLDNFITDTLVISQITQTDIGAIAFDPDVGNNNGDGVALVEFEWVDGTGRNRIEFNTDDGGDTDFCFFNDTGTCENMSDTRFGLLADGDYILRARALSTDGFSWSNWIEVPVRVPPIELFIAFTNPMTDGLQISSILDTNFEVIAYDPGALTPAQQLLPDIDNNGVGIEEVEMDIIAPGAFRFINNRVSDTTRPYCPLGGSCDRMNSTEYSRFLALPGSTADPYIIFARARSFTSNRWSPWETITFYGEPLATPTPSNTPTATATPNPAEMTATAGGATLTPTTTPSASPTPALNECSASDPVNIHTSGWSSADIGTHLAGPGSTWMEGGQITICSSGEGVDGDNDDFRYVYTNADANTFQSITVRLADWGGDVENDSQFGVMVRNSTNDSSAHGFAYTLGNNKGTKMRRRQTDNGSTNTHGNKPGGIGVWLRLSRDTPSSDELRAWYSFNGVNWVQYETRSVPDLNGTFLIGIGVAEGDDDYVKGVFDNLSINLFEPTPTPPPAISCPPDSDPPFVSLDPGWQFAEVGSDVIGSAELVGNTAQLCGSDRGLTGGGSGDSFTYVYQNVGSDFNSITARVTVWNPNGDNDSRMGLMVRKSTDDGSQYVAIALRRRPEDGLRASYRTVAGGGASGTSRNPIDDPIWLRLTRISSEEILVTYSFNGTDWIEHSTQLISDLGDSFMAGVWLISDQPGNDANDFSGGVLTDITIN